MEGEAYCRADGSSWHGSPLGIVEQQPWEANLMGGVSMSWEMRRWSVVELPRDTASPCLFVLLRFEYLAFVVNI